MDIDAIIEQLERMTKYRGVGGLVEATERAPELLRQPQYASVPDRSEALAQDLEVAVARLPEPARVQAKTLLPIAMPEAYIKERLGQLGLDRASAPAKRWHRQAALGRVAFEYLRLAVTPSHRVVSVNIHLYERTKPIAGAGGPYKVIRVFEVRWRIERLVADLRWFAFPFPTPSGLRRHLMESPRGLNCAWSYGPAKDGSEWYMGVYPQGLPMASESTADFYISLLFRVGRKAPKQFEFTPTVPIEQVSLSLELGERPACVERDAAGRIHKTLRAKTKIRALDDLVGIGDPPEIIRTTFTARKPHLGRYFQLTW
jgi:hypothetical protein